MLIMKRILDAVKDNFSKLDQDEFAFIDKFSEALSNLKKKLYSTYLIKKKANNKISIIVYKKKNSPNSVSKTMSDPLSHILPNINEIDLQGGAKQTMIRTGKRMAFIVPLVTATTVAMAALANVDKPKIALVKVGLVLGIALSMLLKIQTTLVSKTSERTQQAIITGGTAGLAAGLVAETVRRIGAPEGFGKKMVLGTAVTTSVLGAVIHSLSTMSSMMQPKVRFTEE